MSTDHRTPPRTLAPWARTAAGAVLGHLVGAVVGVVLVSGPAEQWSTETGLLLVHLLADVGAGFGAVRLSPSRVPRPTSAVATVLVVGALLSAVVLWPLGAEPIWLLLRAAVVVLAATLLVQRAALPFPPRDRGRAPMGS